MESVAENMLERHKAINKAFGRMYFAIYSVNLESGRYLEVSTLDIFKEHIPSSEDNQLLFDMVVKHYVSEGYKEGMRAFLDMSTVQERLAKQNAVSNEFFGTTQGWCRASLVVEKRSPAGQVQRLVYVTQEINAEVKTEQERIAQLKRAYAAADTANQAKTDFLSRMSHDIRTPLNAIMGFDELLKHYASDEKKVLEFADKIKVSGNLLLSLLNEILDMTKIESGKAEAVNEPFSLRCLANELEMVISAQAAQNDQTFVCDLSGVIHDGFAGDGVRLSRVLFNILGNAVKYTGRGGKIEFAAREDECPDPDGRVLLTFEVRDNGIGIDPKDQEQIFEKYTRGGDSQVLTVPGTGLGLPIAKNFVEMMGGEISVSSSKGAGSTFTVKLPLALSEPPECSKEVRSGGASGAGAGEPDEGVLSGLHVLIVEDNEMNMEISVGLLEIAGVICDTAASGAEAIEKVKGAEPGAYDFILMDVRMPRMNGYETTRKIRGLECQKAARIPIIALTANAFEEDVDNAKNAGMDAHIAKPLDMKELSRTLQLLFSQRVRRTQAD